MLCDAKKVIRRDGSHVIVMKNPTWKTELYGLYDTLKHEPFVILLFPMFWSSNWFYTYQGNAINVAYFNTRTRALNSFLYWLAQIVAASIIGPLLDMKYFRRTVRARGAWAVLFILTMVIWGGGWAWQKHYTRRSVDPKITGFKVWDWTHPGYVGPMFLYFFYGFYDAVWQGTIYWSVFSHLLPLSPPAPSFIHNPLISSQLNLTPHFQVHGSPFQLGPQRRQLRRILQRYPIRGCGRDVECRL